MTGLIVHLTEEKCVVPVLEIYWGGWYENPMPWSTISTSQGLSICPLYCREVLQLGMNHCLREVRIVNNCQHQKCDFSLLQVYCLIHKLVINCFEFFFWTLSPNKLVIYCTNSFPYYILYNVHV